MHRVFPLGVLLAAVTLGPAPLAAQSPEPAKEAVGLSDAEQERFLLEGRIVRRRSAPGGVTLSDRATLRLGNLEHECHIQNIDQHMPSFAVGGVMEMDFHDSFRGNVAGYRLDPLLGLGMVPVSVARNAVRAAMKDVLTPAQTDGLLARRDLIVKYFDARIAEIGEEKVLYDLPPRIAVPANAH